MRNISAENHAALQARRLVPRDFLWIKARTIDTGVPFEYGFWSDVGNVSAPVIDPNTGLAQTRNFEGSGTLISVGDISLSANVKVQDLDIELSQLHPAAEALVRGYDLQRAQVEIYRGLFSPTTRQLVAPALCRFVGYVDGAPIETPEEGGVGKITLECKSHTQEMTRSNPDTRSHESQLLRSPTDNFYQDTTVVGEWEFFWGKKSGKLGNQPR